MARPKKDLSRGAATRQQNKRVLIVCEGEKTEPYYLDDLVRDLRIHAQVKVTGDCGSAPISVVGQAIGLFNAGPGYEFVYCVFDRDGHVSFDDAVRKVSATKLRGKGRGRVEPDVHFEAITSVPCFEYWVLLHYVNSNAPLLRFCNVLPLLKKHKGLEAYDKGSRKLYSIIKDKTDTAIANSRRVLAAAERDGISNPLTKMHSLVESLRSLSTV